MYRKLIIQNINMKLVFICLALSMIFQNCSNWKKNLIQKGNYEIAIENAVVDFCNTSSLVNKDKVFILKRLIKSKSTQSD